MPVHKRVTYLPLSRQPSSDGERRGYPRKRMRPSQSQSQSVETKQGSTSSMSDLWSASYRRLMNSVSIPSWLLAMATLDCLLDCVYAALFHVRSLPRCRPGGLSVVSLRQWIVPTLLGRYPPLAWRGLHCHRYRHHQPRFPPLPSRSERGVARVGLCHGTGNDLPHVWWPTGLVGPEHVLDHGEPLVDTGPTGYQCDRRPSRKRFYTSG